MSKNHLWLIRHAKATAHSAEDHSRDLSKRGLHQCEEIGHDLASRSNPPKIFLASDAKRALTTAQRMNDYLKVDVIPVANMYTFDVDLLEDAIFEAIEANELSACDCIAVVGHNSAVSDLLARLTKDQSTKSLPTCGVACVSFEGQWQDLLAGIRADLIYQNRPTSKRK